MLSAKRVILKHRTEREMVISMGKRSFLCILNARQRNKMRIRRAIVKVQWP